MVSIRSVLVASSAFLGAFAAPLEELELQKRQTITSSTTGTNNGYYFSFYNSAGGVQYTNGPAGEYSVTWNNDNDFVAGKGWNPGSAQPINYTANFQTTGNAYLSVYGWFTDPLVEYYITESYGDYNPGSQSTHLGTVTSDGGVYDIYTDTRTNEPSIEGTSTFNQYFSVRQTKRTSGTVTTANHFNAWNALGLQTGTFNYQILATEGYESSGSSTVTVGSTGGSTSPSGPSSVSSTAPTSATSSTAPSSTGATQAQWGQCGGVGWTGPTVCASPYTCHEQNSYYSQCY